MSPIEALKSEAIALRQKKKDLGRALKHCDALEQVAKKHWLRKLAHLLRHS